MVKPDTGRDYYADLELTPDCSNEDIKRQFRKLALKYHPDRNPGKEIDVNTKFQEVNAAHEVLGNPDTRKTYDLSRRRGNVNTGNFARPTPPRRRDPFPASNFPPPPRRGQGRPPPGPPPQGPNGGGAQRYTHFPPPPPPPRAEPNSAQQDADARQNMFRAWQKMKQGNNPQPPRQKYPVPPAWSGPRQTRHNMQTDDPDASYVNPQHPPQPPPRSAYEEVNSGRQQGFGRHDTGANNSRRGGFDPSSPGVDEAPAAGSGYNAIPRYGRSSPPKLEDLRSQPPIRGHAPTAKRPSAPQPNRQDSADDVTYQEPLQRERNPYHAKPVDASFVTDPLKRSESMRESSTSRANRIRAQRGVSFDESRNSNAGPTSYGHQSAAPSGPQARPPHTRPFIVSYSSSEESVPQTASKAKGHDYQRRPSQGSSYQSSSSAESSNADSDPSDRPKARPSPAWTHRKSAPSPLGKSRSLEEKQQWQEQSSGRRGSYHTGVDGRPIPHAATFSDMRQGETLSADPHNGQPRGPPTEDHLSTSSQNLPRVESQPAMSSSHSQQNRAEHRHDGQDGNHNTRPLVSPPANDTFSFSTDQNANWAQRWAFASGSPPRQTSSNTGKQRTPSSRSRGNFSGSARPQHATVADEEDNRGRSHGVESAGSEDSNAMDIDPPDAHHTSQHPSIIVEDRGNSNHPAARHVYVQPSRADWRDGARGNADGQRKSSQSNSPDRGPPLPPKIRSGDNLSMDSFRHVAPLSANANGGMQDMSDMSLSLPFESQASSSHPSRMSNIEPAELDIPNPPKAPKFPDQLDNQSWRYHLGQMEAYVNFWSTYNNKMVAHFQDRAVQMTELSIPQSNKMINGWLGAAGGETAELGGWDTYVRLFEEERVYRKEWEKANMRHAEAISKHTVLRQRALQQGIRA